VQFDDAVQMLLEKLKIVAPAVKLPSGKVVAGKPGNMHVDVHDRIIKRLAALHHVSKQVASNRFYRMTAGHFEFEDGFVDSAGHFQTRQQAWHTSKKYNPKIARKEAALQGRKNADEHRKMASEWIPQDEHEL
jgi:hypothetical protein